MENSKRVLEVKYCTVDRLYYLENERGETIATFQFKPLDDELAQAISSDDWHARFEDMRGGKKVQVSDRIYWAMLECVPPKAHSALGFINGECYSGSQYYVFTNEDGKKYGQLMDISEAKKMLN